VEEEKRWDRIKSSRIGKIGKISTVNSRKEKIEQ